MSVTRNIIKTERISFYVELGINDLLNVPVQENVTNTLFNIAWNKVLEQYPFVCRETFSSYMYTQDATYKVLVAFYQDVAQYTETHPGRVKNWKMIPGD